MTTFLKETETVKNKTSLTNFYCLGTTRFLQVSFWNQLLNLHLVQFMEFNNSLRNDITNFTHNKAN